MAKKTITLILETELLKETDKYAKKDERDRSSYIRKAITEKIDIDKNEKRS